MSFATTVNNRVRQERRQQAGAETAGSRWPASASTRKRSRDQAGKRVTWTRQGTASPTLCRRTGGSRGEARRERFRSRSTPAPITTSTPSQPGHGGGDRHVSLRRDVIILACAISAGVHGALAPAHLDVGTGTGVGFVASTVLLAALVLALTLRPAGPLPLWPAQRSSSPGCSRAMPSRRRPGSRPSMQRDPGRRSCARHQGDRGRRPGGGAEPAPATRGVVLIQVDADMNETRAMRPVPSAPSHAGCVLRRPDHPLRFRTGMTPARMAAQQRTRKRSFALPGRFPQRHACALGRPRHVDPRLAIISLTTGSPDTQATVGRLLRNQVDIGTRSSRSTARRP